MSCNAHLHIKYFTSLSTVFPASPILPQLYRPSSSGVIRNVKFTLCTNLSGKSFLIRRFASPLRSPCVRLSQKVMLWFLSMFMNSPEVISRHCRVMVSELGGRKFRSLYDSCDTAESSGHKRKHSDTITMRGIFICKLNMHSAIPVHGGWLNL